MSDGPHRSLPMHHGWKRFAERANIVAFEMADVAASAIPALGKDWTQETNADFIGVLLAMADSPNHSLFANDELKARLPELEAVAGRGLGRSVVDNLTRLSTSNQSDIADLLVKAVTSALRQRGAAAARQVEEHLCRKSTARSQGIRARIEAAVQSAPIESLARKILKRDGARVEAPIRRRGLEEGVPLR